MIFVCLLLALAGSATGMIRGAACLFGLYMGATFVPNHKGMPIVPADVKLDFLRRRCLAAELGRSGHRLRRARQTIRVSVNAAGVEAPGAA